VDGGRGGRGWVEPYSCRSEQREARDRKEKAAARSAWPEQQREADQGEPDHEDGQLDGDRRGEARFGQPADGPPEWVIARGEQTTDEHDRVRSQGRGDPKDAANPSHT